MTGRASLGVLMVIAAGCGAKSDNGPPSGTVATSEAAVITGTAQATLQADSAAHAAWVATVASDSIATGMDTANTGHTGVILKQGAIPLRASVQAALDIDSMIGDDLDLAQMGLDQFFSRTPSGLRGTLATLSDCLDSWSFTTQATLESEGVVDPPVARLELVFIRPESKPQCRAEGRAVLDLDVESVALGHRIWLAITYPEGIVRRTGSGHDRTVDPGGSLTLAATLSEALELMGFELGADYCAVRGEGRKVCFDDVVLSLSGSVSAEMATRVECVACTSVYGTVGQLIDSIRSANLHLVVNEAAGELTIAAQGTVAMESRQVVLGDGVTPISLTVGRDGDSTRYVIIAGTGAQMVKGMQTAIVFSASSGSQGPGLRAVIDNMGTFTVDGCVETSVDGETQHEICFDEAQLRLSPTGVGAGFTLWMDGTITKDDEKLVIDDLTLQITTGVADSLALSGTITHGTIRLELTSLSFTWDEATSQATLGGVATRQVDGATSSLLFCDGTLIKVEDSSATFEGCLLVVAPSGSISLGHSEDRLFVSVLLTPRMFAARQDLSARDFDAMGSSGGALARWARARSGFPRSEDRRTTAVRIPDAAWREERALSRLVAARRAVDQASATTRLNGPVVWEPSAEGKRFQARFTEFSVRTGATWELGGTVAVVVQKFSATLGFAEGFTAERSDTSVTVSGTVSLSLMSGDGMSSATGTLELTTLTASNEEGAEGEAESSLTGRLDLRLSELEVSQESDLPTAHIRMSYGGDSGPFRIQRGPAADGLGAVFDGAVAVCLAQDCDAVNPATDLTAALSFQGTHARWTQDCGWQAPDAGTVQASEMTSGPALRLTVKCTCKGKPNWPLIPSALTMAFDALAPTNGSVNVTAATGQCDADAASTETCEGPGELYLKLKTCP